MEEEIEEVTEAVMKLKIAIAKLNNGKDHQLQIGVNWEVFDKLLIAKYESDNMMCIFRPSEAQNFNIIGVPIKALPQISNMF